MSIGDSIEEVVSATQAKGVSTADVVAESFDLNWKGCFCFLGQESAPVESAHVAPAAVLDVLSL